MLLICDANILIDIETGGLVAPMFSLDYTFVVPDVLFIEELESSHGSLLDMGLESRELSAHMVARVGEMSKKFTRPSRNDLFALVLALEEGCPLLTGDRGLKASAEKENVEVRGTLWLVIEMMRRDKISPLVARGAFQRMKNHGRRLPWNAAERLLDDYDHET